MNDVTISMIERLKLAEIYEQFSGEDLKKYIKRNDVLNLKEGQSVPKGYKKCNKCGRVLKLYLFNKNSSGKLYCTGHCKECQRNTAKKSYKKTKAKRNYKKYYEEHKDEKRERARQYYEENKEDILTKQKDYHKTRKGKKVMRTAHQKRAQAIRDNKGIPYTRALVIERDSKFIDSEYPICNICGKPITDISGAALHLDHVVPIVIGGLDCFTNVACVHAECNLRKEKDARNTDADEIDRIVNRSEAFIDAFPEQFEEED